MTYIVSVHLYGKTVQSSPLTATETMDAMRRIRRDYPSATVKWHKQKEG